MAKNDVYVPISGITNQITIRVHLTGYRGWRIRQWIAMKFVHFGVWLLGVNVVIDQRQNE